jgi:molybdate transport system substrate-binding protein
VKSRRRFGAVAAFVFAVTVSGGCAGSNDDGLTVFGASSLAQVLPAVDRAPTYQFAASDTLALQIREGATVDVFAAANETLPDELFAAGVVARPQVFATNRLVILVPTGNPGRVRTVADLGRSGVRFVVAAEGVPVGDYAREAFARIGQPKLIERAASFEDDARSVVAKVALGEADAGIAYATDARAAADTVTIVELPARAQPEIRYAVAIVTAARNGDAARAFVRRLLGPDGRAALTAGGFGVP